MRRCLILLRRVYDTPGPEDGRRILVDRLWPRGLSRQAAAVDAWVKQVAPSEELRRWFGHRVARWPEFVSRYESELAANPGALAVLAQECSEPRVTFLYAAKDPEHNNAVVLKNFLETAGFPDVGAG